MYRHIRIACKKKVPKVSVAPTNNTDNDSVKNIVKNACKYLHYNNWLQMINWKTENMNWNIL